MSSPSPEYDASRDPALIEGLRLLDLGCAVHRLRPGEKRPVEEGWQKAAVHTPATLRADWRAGDNLGVRLGEPSRIGRYYLHAIDLDIRDDGYVFKAMAALKKLLPEAELLPRVGSGSGGYSKHFWFLSERPFASRKLAKSEIFVPAADGKKQRAWEIELFGTGKQVACPPSIHPSGKPYRWERRFDLEEIELTGNGIIAAERIEAWGASTSEREEDDSLEAAVHARPIGYPIEKIPDLLKRLPLDEWCEDRGGWLKVGMALHHEYGGSEEAYEAWCDFSQKSAKFDPDDQRKNWDSLRTKSNPVRLPTLIRAAGIAADEAPENEDALGLDDVGKSAEEHWTRRLERNEDGQIKGTTHNLTVILKSDSVLRRCPCRNDLTEALRYLPSAVPFLEGMALTGALGKRSQKATAEHLDQLGEAKDPVNGDAWTDDHSAEVRIYLETTYRIRVSGRDLDDALRSAARAHRFHPVKKYYESLRWDGKPRLDSLFVDYLGCPDTPYHRAAARLTVLAAVARTYEPGHKFDFVPILEGPQGSRKSTFVRTLAKHWGGDMDRGFDDRKVAMELTGGRLVIEIPELNQFDKSEINALKAFFSAEEDKARMAYARHASERPRQCIFIGTTNDSTYLRDPTGGRRFWPIMMNTGSIDTDRLKAEVDQVWAEALVIYREMRARQPDGTLPLYLTERAAQEEALRLQESRRVEDDATVGLIEKFLTDPVPPEGSYFTDPEADELLGTPKVYRTETCLLEIWVKVFGGSKESYARTSNWTRFGKDVQRAADRAGWYNAGRHRTEYGQQTAYRRRLKP